MGRSGEIRRDLPPYPNGPACQHVRVCIPLRAAELVELAAVGEDDERDLGVAEHGELVRLLEQAVAALGR